MTDINNKIFLEALLTGNRIKSSEILKDTYNKGLPVEDIYENLIRTSLYEVGRLWETGKISVATEHLASAIVEGLLIEMYHNILSLNTKEKKVVVSCMENEFHQIGSRMVADIFEHNDWETYYLGANTPTVELIPFIKDKKPDIVALSLTLSQNLPVLDQVLDSIRKELPNTPVIIGGQAFQKVSHDLETKYNNVRFFEDLKSLQTCIKSNC